MPSRPLTRAQIIDQAENFLQSASWGATELGLLLDDALTEVSEAVPYVMRDVYQIETRTGTATSTLANSLVDATESQFASTDTGKVVYNVDDKTWAVVTSAATTTLTLSKDIFTSGEHYEIYNKGCWAQNQVNINNSNDFLWVVKVCYPVDRANYGYEVPRNFNVIRRNEFDTILEIDVINLDDTKDTDANKDVYVYLAKQHKLNTMTDLFCATSAGYAAGVLTIGVTGLTAADAWVYKDSLFYFTQLAGVTVDSRNIYRVTADAAIAAETTATLIFYPALETAVSTADDITFIKSTLTPELERIIVQILIGEALMARSIKNIDNIVTGEGVSQKQFTTGERIAEKARARLHRKVDPNLRAEKVYGR